ncbi:MAG: photosystem II protein PsbQ [Leptolyngbyaceae cyanobacterium RU_5_1]|nr:photosystem II protein PsbQ [Leptolyngbyaceae cyanobacterium RU_5_1]
MVNYRSVLAMILAFVTALMLSVGSAEAAKTKKPLTYTSEQLEQIQDYVTDLRAMRDRLPELAILIQQQDWTFTRNFIHGPLGELRFKMASLSRTLLPDAQKNARALAKTVSNDLVAIDLAAQKQDYKAAIRSYAQTIRDFDAFLDLAPQPLAPKPAPAKPQALNRSVPKPEPVKPVLSEPEVSRPETSELEAKTEAEAER